MANVDSGPIVLNGDAILTADTLIVLSFRGLLPQHKDLPTDYVLQAFSPFFSTKLFTKFACSENPFNQKYDDVYISAFQTRNDPIFLEHEQLLLPEEIVLIASVIKLIDSQNIM